MDCFNFMKYKIHSNNDIKKELLNLSLKNSVNEGLFDFENDTAFVGAKYFKKILSAELVFDQKNEKIHSKSLPKVMEAQIYIKNNSLVIMGSPTSCQFLEDYLHANSSIIFKPVPFKFEEIINSFKIFDYNIYKLTFYNVNFLSSRLPSITLEFKNNHDAFNTIKKLNAKPMEMVLKLNFDEDTVKINIVLDSGFISVEPSNVYLLEFEKIKESCLNLIEENKNV